MTHLPLASLEVTEDKSVEVITFRLQRQNKIDLALGAKLDLNTVFYKGILRKINFKTKTDSPQCQGMYMAKVWNVQC